MTKLALFEGYGIEIESVVVDAESLDVRSIVDELLRDGAGGDAWVEDVDDGPIGWSNELVNHCIELKTNGPVASFDGVADAFLTSVARLTDLARGRGARLLPTGMHPWMDPSRETQLWPHDHGPVYRAYDRLFDCRRHGWANLQSVHLNLPFASEEELARLMAASRIVLPLIPALAASSPVMEGRATGRLDNRLDVYRTNSDRVRAMTGDVIPEPIYTEEAYRTAVLGAIDRELEQLGADEVLRGGQEWTNARGAIVRFDRDAVEIRLIDAQESARSDLAVAAAVSGAIQALALEHWSDHATQRDWPTSDLVELLGEVLEHGRSAPLPRDYAALFGTRDVAAGDLWRHVTEAGFPGSVDLEPALAVVHEHGTLAERILVALGDGFDGGRLRDVYRELCGCLESGVPFVP